MMTNHGPPPFPSRQEVEAKFQSLVQGDCTREAASDWAAQWFLADQRYGVDIEVKDLIVWEALSWLYGSDTKTSPTSYLYEESDFQSWLEEIRHASEQDAGQGK